MTMFKLTPAHAALFVFPLVALFTGSAARADDVQSAVKGWSVSVTPYIWVPSVNGNLSFTGPAGGALAPGGGTGRINVTTNPNSYLPNLNSGLMFSGEIRKGPMAIGTDLIYVNSSAATTNVTSVTGPLGFVTVPITASVQNRANAVIWTLAPSYTVVHTPLVSLDVLTGFRYIGINAALGWQFTAAVGPANIAANGNLAQSQTIWDWIGGIRGQIGSGDKHLFVPYYFDAGTGTSAFTWQGVMGVGYAASNYWDVRLLYRHLSYNEPSNGGLVQQIRLSGPALGASFHF